MDMLTKIPVFKFGIVFMLILIIPWLFTCSSKKVGPNTPPEFDFDEPPEPSQVVLGSVDYAAVEEYRNILQTAIDSGKVTVEVQNALDNFSALVGQTDLNYLVSIDSTQLANIATQLETTGQLPQQIVDILNKLSSWNFLPIVTESSVTDTSQGSSNQFSTSLAKVLGPFEDCIDLVTQNYEQLLADAQQARDEGLAAAAVQGNECVTGQPARLALLKTIVDAICSFASQEICDILTATYNLSYLADLAACHLLQLSTENAYNNVYNQTVADLNSWRAAQNDICHQSFGGG